MGNCEVDRHLRSAPIAHMKSASIGLYYDDDDDELYQATQIAGV